MAFCVGNYRADFNASQRTLKSVRIFNEFIVRTKQFTVESSYHSCLYHKIQL